VLPKPTSKIVSRLGSVMDGFVAASAAVHGFTIATRDTQDFAGFGIALLDPWQEAAER